MTIKMLNGPGVRVERENGDMTIVCYAKREDRLLRPSAYKGIGWVSTARPRRTTLSVFHVFALVFVFIR